MGTLPESVSTFGAEIDSLYYVILWITGIVFVAVEATLIWFVIRYRHREGRVAHHTHGNLRIEIVWTVIPFLIVLTLGAMSWGPWSRAKNPARFPAPGLELSVMAKQFEWNFTYPGADGRLGSDDDFVVRNQLHIPVGTPVLVHIASEDVIHSFFLPEFRVKQDLVPGMEGQVVWFEAIREGQYTLACAELCGTGHTRMMGSVTVHSAEDFEAWHRRDSGPAN